MRELTQEEIEIVDAAVEAEFDHTPETCPDYSGYCGCTDFRIGYRARMLEAPSPDLLDKMAEALKIAIEDFGRAAKRIYESEQFTKARESLKSALSEYESTRKA